MREDYYRQLSRQHPEFYLRHARVTSWLVRPMTSIASCLPPRRGADAGGFTGNGLRCVDYVSTQISWQLTLFALLPMPVMRS